MKNNKKHIIWSSNINYEEWIEQMKSDLENYLLDNEYESTVDEYIEENSDAIYNYISELNNDYLFDEKTNLNIDCNDIICIADIGRWNGRKAGYCLEGNNISQILHTHVNGFSDIEFFVQNGELQATEWHHDGTNYYTYRELKPNLSEVQTDELFEKILSGRFTVKDLNKYTKPLGNTVSKVYGWKLAS